MLEVITENFHIFAQEPLCFDLLYIHLIIIIGQITPRLIELTDEKYNIYSKLNSETCLAQCKNMFEM